MPISYLPIPPCPHFERLQCRRGRAVFRRCGIARKAVEVEKVRSGRLWFGDYICRDDCSGHETGWGRAKQEGVEDDGACPANHGGSFEQGCWSFVQAREKAHFLSQQCDTDSSE